MSGTNFTVTKVVEPYVQRKEIALDITEENSGGEPHGQFFYKNPQYTIRCDSPVPKTAAVRISYEGPKSSFTTVVVSQPGNNNRILTLQPEIADVLCKDRKAV